MINKNVILLGVCLVCTFSSCNKFLERESQAIFTDDQIFSDQNMIKSVLANYYGRISWGQQFGDNGSFAMLDEAGFSSGGPNTMQEFPNDFWRMYDYELIRNLNQFIVGVRQSSLDENNKKSIEGEARFIRAWTYFNMIKRLGGVPLVGDKIYDYTGGMDPAELQTPRSTEAESYNYVINECTEAAKMLGTEKTINSARANKWTALALKARASLYAASIAKYNYKTPDVKTAGNEVGIPAADANKYYEIAYESALDIINNSPYALYNGNADKGKNFYLAVSSKSSSNEVIWAKDYAYPGETHFFTNNNIASSVRGDIDANFVTPVLNLVEAFEYTDDRNGALKTKTATGDYIYYNNPEEIFAHKDARLYGTVIYSGADFAGTKITYQAGVRYKEGGVWKTMTAIPGTSDSKFGGIITSKDGPTTSNDMYVNKTGFNIRKFIDENKDASTRGRGSDIWFVRFRYAEFLLIAAEAGLELGKPQAELTGYVNKIRERAGIQALTTISLNDIIQERRVEFAFEDHRYWDLKRLRIAHEIWNGSADNYNAVHYALFPYKIYAPGDPNDGKWVFEKQKSSHTLYPRNFKYQNYYNFIDQDWINNNPKLVRNPYQ
ncbi:MULTISPECIES: RagB/SusD family nutrient uptake outer membrane protein [Sphingobacterium]|uniref:Putative outer membrane starch-binding protein n=1 Tax=Sphingobacterium siyangense TaxID=459529 RepID=A0A562MET5_9SPHI|nr:MULTISPECIES: RagB/SusD family nutrient uptake outer membrane protein [Sphingobacterium]QQT46741.1 RagB/SusD family nutrient uptake outer membrane protein [Sphingobacterium multivorum]TWI18445.1 putative outer membrane starch-binding protein [Sphingobacterium siyangense]SUJ89082.1 SusD family [Sphingobacterium multivorum]